MVLESLTSSNLCRRRTKKAIRFFRCVQVIAILVLSSHLVCDAFTTVPTTTRKTTEYSSSCPFQNDKSFAASESSSSTTSLNLFFGGGLGSSNKFNGDGGKQIPYIIESIDTYLNPQVFDDVANLCIDVFFKEQMNNAKPDDRIAPWKEAQISYLKMLQAGDLKRRRQRYPKTNKMLIAYEVLPTSSNNSALWKRQPLILDLDQVQNLPSDIRHSGQEFVKGNLIGFCEITQRPYGLGEGDVENGMKRIRVPVNTINGDDDPAAAATGSTRQQMEQQRQQEMTMRPVLTNLAVSWKARKSGIGSRLVDECEKHVLTKWNLNEVVLEVEDFNNKALKFYKRRGYKVLFSDPASRRYDVTGLLLRKVRCTREIMRKPLSLQPTLIPPSPLSNDKTSNDRTYDLFRKIRDTVGSFELIK